MRNLTTRMVGQKKFQQFNIQVLGISGNNTFSNKTFAASLELTFPLLSDFPNLTTIRAYGVMQRLGKTGNLHAKQAWFLIDKQGVVRGRWVVDNVTQFPNDEIFRAAENLP
ncbi:MAG: redoxin domain-containing protein [SAR324 cluster bacterium]|nr:redoxin domain-containing protein [SAR324 cluster bacterium]